jgi:hypothetical protein
VSRTAEAAVAVKRAQCNDSPLGTIYKRLYEFANWVVAEFFEDTPRMAVPVLALEQDKPSRSGFYDPAYANSGPRICLNPYSANDGVGMGETLVHELLHHWQYTVGRPTEGNHHTAEFHERMWALFGIKTDEENGRHFGHDERWDEIVDVMKERFHLDSFKLPGANAKAAPRRMLRHHCPGCGESFHARTKKSVKCVACDIEYEVD